MIDQGGDIKGEITKKKTGPILGTKVYKHQNDI